MLCGWKQQALHLQLRKGHGAHVSYTPCAFTTSKYVRTPHTSVAAASAASNAPAPEQQQRQQPSSSRAPQPIRVEPQKPKPYLIRVAGRTSSVQGAAGAIVKRLRTEDLVRVAAIDAESIQKALITLTAANNMVQANSGHMLVFQPTLVTAAAAEPPKLPEGALVMYTGQVLQGEVMAFNTLRVVGGSPLAKLSKAITSRISSQGHTVLECFGAQAAGVALQAVAEARKGLLPGGQDLACIITSTPKINSSSITSHEEEGSSSSSAAAAAGATEQPQVADISSSSSSSSSGRSPLCHRLVLLECRPRNPRALLVSATMGVSDRLRQSAPPPQPPAQATGVTQS